MENTEPIVLVPDVQTILKAWGFEDLIQTFTENEIDWNLFLKLTPEAIKELIPKLGTRMNFLEKFSKLKQNEIQLDELETDILDENLEVNLTVPIKSPDASSVGSSVDISENVTLVRQYATVGMSEVETVKAPFYQYNVKCAENSGLEDLLNSTPRGKLIFYSYKKNNKLTAEYRNKLVELIIENELENDINKKITIHRFQQLAAGIEALFPSECKEVYFMKITINKNGKSRFIGRGKLFAKYYNFRKQLRLNGLISNRKTELENDSTDLQSSDDDNREDFEALEWLKHNREPFQKVESLWKKTFTRRKRLLNSINIHEYFQLFPILKINSGYNLFNIDFTLKFPENDVFYLNWSMFASNVLSYANCYCKDKTVVKLLAEIECGHLTEDSRNNRILKILPYLVTPVAVTKQWKPSKAEIDEGFILHIKNILDLQNMIDSKITKLQNFNLTFQPTPIIVGKSLDDITNCYVRINTVLFSVESPLKAVDIAFKAVHSLNALYAPEAEQVWMIIQKALYNITTKYDKGFTSVSVVVPHLKVANQ